MVEAAARREDRVTIPAGTPAPSVREGIRQGSLEVRLARNAADTHAAQKLRFRVFFQEMGACPAAAVAAAERDFDRFDDYCDHLLVLDHSRPDEDRDGDGRVIGTYRLLRRSAAVAHGGFYTETEFDIGPLLAVPGEIMEVGRACVDAAHRNRPTMQLLWRGIASYTVFHDIKVMFGCASLPGTDPEALARPLSYLHHNHLAPPHLRARALPDRYVATDLLPSGEIDAEAAVAEISVRATLSALPPLIKGYLRLGGMIGDGAVIDPEFRTTDVCIIVATDQLTDKYFNHYLRNA